MIPYLLILVFDTHNVFRIWIDAATLTKIRPSFRHCHSCGCLICKSFHHFHHRASAFFVTIHAFTHPHHATNVISLSNKDDIVPLKALRSMAGLGEITMATVGLTFKRVFNEAHNHLQNTVLPLGITSTSGHPSSLSMPSQSGTTFRDELKEFLEHVKHVVLIPLSWWLTIWHFIMSLTWAFLVSARILPPRGLVINRICISHYRSESPSRSTRTKSESDSLSFLPSWGRWPCCSQEASSYRPSQVLLPVRTRARVQPGPIFLPSTIPRY